MVLIKWSNDYAVGVAEIDSQHRELFKLFDDLNDAMATHKEKQVTEKLLSQLIDFWDMHCKMEENYMKQFGCSGLHAHHFAHDGFKKKLHGVLEKMKRGETISELESLPILHAWLRGHILGTDKKHSQWIIKQQRAAIAEDSSAYVKWTDDFSVGVAEIDSQHQELVEMINTLHASMTENVQSPETTRILAELADYTQRHFKTEEDYMLLFHFSEYAEHKQAHDEFVGKVLDLQNRAKWGSDLLGLDVLDFIKTWFEEHLVGVDKKYMECFKAAGLQ